MLVIGIHSCSRFAKKKSFPVLTRFIGLETETDALTCAYRHRIKLGLHFLLGYFLEIFEWRREEVKINGV